MENLYSVRLTKLVEDYDLEVLRASKDYERCEIKTGDVSRPGLQLIGYFDYYDPLRLEVLGKVEKTFLDGMNPRERRESFEQLMAQGFPALILCRGMEPFPECMEMAEKYDRTILRTEQITTEFMGTLITSLRNHLAPRITRHGVLVEIYGEGVLIYGESGVGKSETAIELIKRGHRLIADDAVEIKQMNDHQLVGSAPELIRHYMELRGIGVVDVRRLFGVSAIKDSANIDLVVNLEPWRDGAVYDRLGLEELHTTILDIELPAVTIPVKPGRNLAVIIEVAAMNNRHKRMGYNAAQAFTDQINKHFEEAMAQQEESGEGGK